MKYGLSFAKRVHLVKAVIPNGRFCATMITLCDGTGMLMWGQATDQPPKRKPLCKLCRKLKTG
jgi:hypothetical protein